MNTNITEIVLNKLVEDDSGIYISNDKKEFKYSDGVHSEKYLENVLLKVSDLSSDSYELEEYIIDWNSEYHLSRKRSQLLKGINFDKNKEVLEVGCGCGAITRFLGEKFENVVAIEGSYERAKIAKLRTRDLNNIKILCSPFQEIQFTKKFDIIFCIGVFEYSGIFVNDQDPYNFILDYFSDLLQPDGEVIIAIENQFGLRYFSYSAEDHNNIMFDGIEGYTRFGNKNAKTFGYNEITKMLYNRFPNIQFYFPYPDYKTPSIVIKEEFFDNSNVSELIGSFKPTTFLKWPKNLFDEKLVLFEIEKNKNLNIFSNSFLIIAKKSFSDISKMKESAIMYSSNRTPEFQTITKFYRDYANNLISEKKLQSNLESYTKLGLTNRKSIVHWQHGMSIQAELLKKIKNVYFNKIDDFNICKIWVEYLKSISIENDDEFLVPGQYIDATWKNTFITGSTINIIDKEWEWFQPISLKRLVIKSIYELLNEALDFNDVNKYFNQNSKKKLICDISKILGIKITNYDLINFIKLESEISEIVFNRNKLTTKIEIYLDLYYTKLSKILHVLFNLANKFKNKIF